MMTKAFPPALVRLIKNLSMLPGIGEKTATRMAMNLLRWPKERAHELAQSISELHDRIGMCSVCYTFSEQDPCPICSDPKRDHGILCVVEDPGDLLALEKAGSFQGVYHVLHGVLAPMDGIGPDELKVEELKNRIKAQGIKEVILATSSTVQGEATAAYLSDVLSGLGVEVTRIACGIPMGMDIKYADGMTLQRAIAARSRI